MYMFIIMCYCTFHIILYHVLQHIYLVGPNVYLALQKILTKSALTTCQHFYYNDDYYEVY